MTRESSLAPRRTRPDVRGSRAARALVLAASLALAPVAAVAGGVAGMATEWTQLANNVELGKIIGLESRSLHVATQSLSVETRQLQTELQALEIMRRNVLKLPASHMNNALEQVLRLRRIAGQAGAIAVDGRRMDDFLRSGLVTDSLYERSGLDRANLAARYDDWNSQWNSSMETNLRQTGLTLEDVGTEARLIDQIQSRMGTEEGQMQVLQGGNLMAASMARQLNDLRRLTATQAEQNSIAWARRLDEMDRIEAAERDHERDLREAREQLGNTPDGPTLNELFRVGE
ncbi:MAG: P-type conjugative transfer protein TrbJ [Boseongicola sp. SB0673_bin_14]|nr:P-type conjugative transfer protein TrbJ [Boseongicola sp. SB0673_bin_14]